MVGCLNINKKTYRINQKNYHKSVFDKSQIIVGFSLRKNNHHINRLLHKKYGKTKKWNTYTISRDGQIYEHYNPRYYSDFIGMKDVDKQSISIVLENMGSLLKIEKKYVNWLNEECDPNLVGEKKWLGNKFWEIIPPQQIENTLLLCDKLCNDFNIKKQIIDFHYQHSEIMKFNGIVLKSNYLDDSNNVNPFFDLIEFNDLLTNN